MSILHVRFKHPCLYPNETTTWSPAAQEQVQELPHGLRVYSQGAWHFVPWEGVKEVISDEPAPYMGPKNKVDEDKTVRQAMPGLFMGPEGTFTNYPLPPDRSEVVTKVEVPKPRRGRRNGKR